MKNNFFEQYKNGNLKEETKKNLDKLKKAVNEFNSRAKFVDKLTPDEREKINNELFYYLAKQSDKLPDFKGILSEQEIEDLKKIIAALREAGVSFKLENEKGVRRLKISVDLLSISLLVGSIVTFPVFGPIGLIIGAATAVVSEVGNIAVNKRLKSAIESNKTVSKVANEIGFDFSESLNDRLKINETKIEIKKEAIAGLERANNLVGWYDRIIMGGYLNYNTSTKIHKALKQSIEIIEKDEILNASNNKQLKTAISFIDNLLQTVSSKNNIKLLQSTKSYLKNIYHPKDIVLENYIESENSDEKNSFNKNGLTINKEQVVGILEKKYEKLLKEIKPDIDYKQTRYESILKLGRVVEAIRNNQAFDTNDFVATIDRLRNSINDVDEKDFGDAAKIKQIALYLINKEIADKSKLAAKAKNISENKIKKGDLLKQDKNVTLLDPGYNGDTDSVDGFIFDKLGLERNSKLQKEMQDQEIDAKFVENEKGSTVLTKIDFGSFEPTENNLADIYYNSFKVCDNQTESLASPLVGDGSLKAEIKTVVNGAVKGVEKFINENPNSKLDIKYIIYEKDKDADKKVENMKNGFKGLANKYEQEVSKAKNELDKILNLEIKTQAKQIKINPTKIIKKPSVKALTLIKNKAKTKISDNKNKKTETDKNNDLIK